MSFDAKSFLKNLTTNPGVYQMYNDAGKIIYVGKAKNLKKRVSSYFRSNHPDEKARTLVSHIAHIEVLITHSENEAFLLEHSLIKKHKPQYNVLLRDDKSYPYLFLSADKHYPRLDFHRGAQSAKGEYFGPYPSASAVRDALLLLQRLFKLRQCNDNFFKNRSRPCLQYQIERCSGPCVDLISPEDYQQQVNYARLFLQAKSQQIIKDLVGQMDNASHNLQFEKAAQLRDLIGQLRKIQEAQYVAKMSGKNTDVIALTIQDGACCIQVHFFRGGRLLGHKAFFPKTPANSLSEEIMEAFMSQFYFSNIHRDDIPGQIICDVAFSEKTWLETMLAEQSGHQVSIAHQVRGERAKWLEMAKLNGQYALQSHLSDKANIYRRLESVQQTFALENIPGRVECFDISHSQGEATMASCVVFGQQGPMKNDYRRYNITGLAPGDDYGALYQAIHRRYEKIKLHEGKLPDVVIIDGGKGQLLQAEKVFQELQLSGVLLLSIAKGPGRKACYDRVFMQGQAQAMALLPDSLTLHFIQQIRDEAHRFAIAGHRNKRAKKRTQSVLQDIPGVGAVKRRELLKYLGGMEQVKNATVDELCKVPGISKVLAKTIFDALH